MKPIIFGAARLGVVTSACLADAWYDLSCLDAEECKLVRLAQDLATMRAT